MFEPHLLVIAEELGELADVLHAISAEVFAQCHIELVSRGHEVKNFFLRLYAQASRVGSQRVELFARCARFHLLEALV